MLRAPNCLFKTKTYRNIYHCNNIMFLGKFIFLPMEMVANHREKREVWGGGSVSWTWPLRSGGTPLLVTTFSLADTENGAQFSAVSGSIPFLKYPLPCAGVSWCAMSPGKPPQYQQNKIKNKMTFCWFDWYAALHLWGTGRGRPSS